MLKNFKKSDGKVSTILLVLAAVLVVLIVVIFLVIKFNALKIAGLGKSTPATTATLPASSQPTTPPAPVYTTTIGDVKFTFESAENLGSVIPSPNQYTAPLTTSEEFIKVTIGAQNIGKVDTAPSAWGVGDVLDSDGRDFISIDNEAYASLPNPNLCGSVMKPAFAPVPCVRFYEVSKISTGFKVQVSATPAGSSKAKTGYIDLAVN